MKSFIKGTLKAIGWMFMGVVLFCGWAEYSSTHKTNQENICTSNENDPEWLYEMKNLKNNSMDSRFTTVYSWIQGFMPSDKTQTMINQWGTFTKEEKNQWCDEGIKSDIGFIRAVTIYIKTGKINNELMISMATLEKNFNEKCKKEDESSVKQDSSSEKERIASIPENEKNISSVSIDKRFLSQLSADKTMNFVDDKKMRVQWYINKYPTLTDENDKKKLREDYYYSSYNLLLGGARETADLGSQIRYIETGTY